MLSNSKYNLYPIKKFFESGIRFGINCKESRILYHIVYQLIQSQLHDDDDLNNFNEFGYSNGQNIYIALLLLWYTQATIINHHCFECGNDWIHHIINFETSYTTRVDDTQYNSNNRDNNNENHNKLLRDKINSIVNHYLPQTITIDYSLKSVEAPFVGFCVQSNSMTNKFQNLISHYLYSKAYSCAFAVAAISARDNMDSIDSMLTSDDLALEEMFKGTIGDNSCAVKYVDQYTVNADTDMDGLLQRINNISRLMNSNVLNQYVCDVIGKHDEQIEHHEEELERSRGDGENNVFTLKFGDFIRKDGKEKSMICVESIELQVKQENKMKYDHVVNPDVIMNAYLVVPTTSTANNIDVNEDKKKDYLCNKIPLKLIGNRDKYREFENEFSSELKFIYSFNYDMSEAVLKIEFFDKSLSMISQVIGIVSWTRMESWVDIDFNSSNT